MSADVEALIIGGGHAGLRIAHGLQRARRRFLIVDQHPKIGDAWRNRWDSLELFTPRALDGLPGLPFPGGPTPFPGKDDIAHYQEEYCRMNAFPIRSGAAVRSLHQTDGGFEARLDDDAIRARIVVVATGRFHAPLIPDFARDLGAGVLQLHSEQYRRPSLLPEGPVLVVGAANSGAEIAVEVAQHRPTTLAVSRLHPRAPARFRDPRWWRVAYVRGYIAGDRKLPMFLPWPLRVGMFTKVDVDGAVRDHGLRLGARAIAATGDRVLFADGTDVRPRTVIWATGFRTDHSWIEVTSGADTREPVARAPTRGLWFVGTRFLFGINRPAGSVVRGVVADLTRRTV